jgi:hypothetical protein
VHWLQQYDFQAFITLTLEHEDIDDSYLNKKLLIWVRKIQNYEKIQLGYLGVVTRHRGPSRKHIHLLMCGHNRHGKTIMDCNPDSFTKYWDSISKIYFITTEEDRDHFIGYLVGKNMGPSYEMITPYNGKLLKKLGKSHF